MSSTEGPNSLISGANDSDYDSDRDYETGRPENKRFICGVVEGFYGRPWNTNQRFELFSRMKEFGMNTYLYAPKDDVKHRAYWRDLYTVEESESLTELIKAANHHDIEFVYAISPGLDMTYSSNKDVTILRRKLDQVSSFGCKAFALLFDDIEPEMNKTDKEIFHSFAHAQASVTNQMYEHLKQPSFMFCPTEYCSTRAIPTVTNSQYLNTLGEKLLRGIEIMWTGPKVVSKVISVSSIKQLTRVIRRPPLIWDNIHANDYDQRRIFLGPFCGRSPALIPLLAGVLTNPNCEFEPNFVALHTLASWSRSPTNLDDSKHCPAIRPETLVEAEGLSKAESNSEELCGYSPKIALRIALQKWLPTFYVAIQPDGGKPPPAKLALAPTPIDEPVIPGTETPLDPVINNIPTTVNTCMAVTPTTQTAPVGLAVCVDKLVGDVDVVPEAENLNGANTEPMDVIAAVACPPSTDVPEKSLLPNSLISVSASAEEDGMQVDEELTSADCLDTKDKLTVEDLEVVCDMFYLPYEHGSKALYLLTEFDWLKANAHVLHKDKKSASQQSSQQQIDEWMDKAAAFQKFVKDFNQIVEKFSKIPNRCLLYDMNNYLWDLRGTISLLNTFVKWLAYSCTVTEYDCQNMEYRLSWSSKGYNEAFMSGDNEPWVFRGGLTGELQRALPLDATDLFIPPRTVDVPTQDTPVYSIRPYTSSDEGHIYDICKVSNSYMIDEDLLDVNSALIPDLLVGGFLALCNQYCFVLEDDDGICGYVMATPDANDFHQKMVVSWLPEMQLKYPVDMSIEKDMLTPLQGLMREFHSYEPERSQVLLGSYPALIRMDLLPRVRDVTVNKRLLACEFAALKSVGVQGAHCISLNNSTHHESMYRYLGFSPAEPDTVNESYTVFARYL